VNTILKWLFAKPSGSRREATDTNQDEIAKIRQDCLDVRDKLVTLREKDLLELREKISGLGLKLMIITAIAVIAGIFGIKQYTDLQGLVDKTFKHQFEQTFGYYDKLMHAISLTQDSKFKPAESAFRELFESRPNDEVVFYKLIDCLIQQGDYKGAEAIVEEAKKGGLLPRKCQTVLSFNNAGYALLVVNIDQPARLDESFGLLQRAEQIGTIQNDPDILYPLYNLALYYVAIGDINKARLYASRWRTLDDSEYKEPSREEWFQRLQKNRPSAAKELREIFAKPSEPKEGTNTKQGHTT